MKRLLPLLFLLMLPFTAKADQSFFYWCMVGNTTASVSGLQSTNTLMASYPQCTVTVYQHGTTSLATLFSDNGVTPLANPFTANTDGSIQWYASDGTYDMTMSGGLNGGFPIPVTVPNILLSSGGGGAQPTVEVNGVVVPPSVYNFINGTGITITNPENGDIRIDSTGGGVCGTNEIPCLNTPNTWTTGIQKFLSSGNTNVPIVVQGFGGGTVTPAYVQGNSVQVSEPFFGCANTLTGVVAGDAIIEIAWTIKNPATPVTISDNNSDAYTMAGFDGTSTTVFVATNVAGGNTTVTMDQTGEVSGCTALEYSGVASSNPIDGLTFGTSGTSSLPIGPVTTANPTDLILTAINTNTATATQPAGYTSNLVASVTSGNWAYSASLIVNSTGSYSGTWDVTGSGSGGGGFIMGLKAGGSALYQTADLVQFNDAAGTTHASINSLGQYVMPAYSSGAFNVPDGPALAYDNATNCPEYYDTGTNAWVQFCGATPPGGSNGSIQVNNSGAFGGATSPQMVTALNATPSSTFAPALLPLATSSAFGAIKPDNVSCTVSAGILACTGSGGGITTLTGDVTASGSGSVAATLATVNSGPGACGDATHVCAVTTNGKGLVTAQSAVAITGIGSVAFSSITGATNTTAAMHVGSGASIDSTGGTITATAMPYSGLTGSVPTWNQNTTGTAAGLTGAPAITVASIIANNLTVGNCLQAGTGHEIVDTGVPCGSGGGGGGGITALTGDVNASGTGSVPAVVKGINSVLMSSLATGILKNATGTGVPSIAVAGSDYLLPSGNGSALTALNATQLTSGTVPAARLPNPSASTLGGIQSIVAVAHNWITSISTLGVPALSQPTFSDIAGVLAVGQGGTGTVTPSLVAGTNVTISGSWPNQTINSTAGISGLTSGFLTKATSTTTVGGSQIDEGITHASAATISDPNGLYINGTGPTLIVMGGSSVSFTPGSGVSSVTCTSVTCQTARGSVSIVGGSATTGTIATITFPTTLAANPICGVSVNGQATYLGIGHGATTTAGFTITSAVSVSGKTVAIDYWCQG